LKCPSKYKDDMNATKQNAGVTSYSSDDKTNAAK